MKTLLTASLLAVFSLSNAAFSQDDEGPSSGIRESYKSPYSVEFSYPLDDLIGDIISGVRGSVYEESSLPHDRWDSHYVRTKYGAWGPPARHYPLLRGLSEKNIEWKRERVIAVGLRYIGRPYQHHHIPDWTPPEYWPWLKVGEGRNTRGIDCSNFSSFIYNQAFGYRFSSDIKAQAEQLEIRAGEGDETFQAMEIKRPANYEDFKKELRTGDLLYIKSRGEVVHVIIWVGKIGRSPDGVPLVLDSTGGNHKDCNGKLIPNGVQLRPFTEDSWYFKGTSHAKRVILGGERNEDH